MPSNSLSGLPSSPTNIFIGSYGCSPNSRTSSQSQQQQQQQQQPNSSRYKTELCRPYEENGVCKYGDKCQFAHGNKELRTLQRHPKYKTELCRTFHTTGFCPYGPRCHFIHNSEESKQHIFNTLKATVPNNKSTSMLNGLNSMDMANVAANIDRSDLFFYILSSLPNNLPMQFDLCNKAP